MDKERQQAIILVRRENKLLYILDEEREQGIIMDVEREQAI